MSDIVDDANDRAERDLERAIAAARNGNGLDAPPPIGECLNCEQVLPYPFRWCDHDCQQDWLMRRGTRKR